MTAPRASLALAIAAALALAWPIHGVYAAMPLGAGALGVAWPGRRCELLIERGIAKAALAVGGVAAGAALLKLSMSLAAVLWIAKRIAP